MHDRISDFILNTMYLLYYLDNFKILEFSHQMDQLLFHMARTTNRLMKLAN